LWSWIVLSGLFNQTVPLVMAAPLLWRWRVWLRTAMVVVVNIIIGYGLIAIDWIKPAVFQVPKGTPMVLFGYFGTNADWHYLIVIPILLVIDIAIYWTLAKSIVKENADEVDA
jgi:cellobiose-specific phosphotransferase system component IIC